MFGLELSSILAFLLACLAAMWGTRLVLTPGTNP